MFQNFLAFSIFAHFQLQALTPDNLLCFLEFLASNKICHVGISHYISAIKTKLSMYGIDVVSFADPRIRYFKRAIGRSSPLKFTIKAIIDITMLTQMVTMCDSMFMGFVYKAAILLSFFSFIRICNLVPHSIANFNPLKQLAQDDVFF